MARGAIRLLVVDDNPDLRRLIAAYLEGDQRFELVGAAEDAFEAVRMVKSLVPDAILLDQMMPHVPGLTVLSRTREIAPGTKVVMYSADITIEHEALARGAAAFVNKSASIDAALGAIDALFPDPDAGPT